MPVVALATGHPLADMTLAEFFLHSLPAEALIVLIAWRWKLNGWFCPMDAKLFRWDALLLPIVGTATRGWLALDGVTWGSDTIRTTSTTYSASGAGQRGDRIKHIRFILFERG